MVGVHDEIRPPSGPIPGGSPHLLNPPPPHVSGAVHVPHWSSPPQLSAAGPQSYPSAVHVVGVQAAPPSGPAVNEPHLLNPPPPHVSGAVHVPQSRTPPQPSPFLPHV